MSGIPVVVVERFGLPVKAVEGRAPVMTVSPYGMGIPIVLSEWGAPFIVEGLVPPLNPPGPINDLSVLSTTTSTIALAFTDAARATSHEYQLDGGGWVPLDPSKVIDSLPPDTSFDVQVRGVNAEDNGPPSNTVQTQTQPVPIPVPVNTAVPTITGIAQVGEELTATSGTWTNSPIGYAYQWQRNAGSWADITGATANTYLLVEDDEGATIRVQVIASNAGGPSVPAYSEPTDPIAPAIPDLGALSLSEDTVTEGGPVTIDILGATAGSTITVQSGALPDGLTLNSGARTITGTPTVEDEFSFTLRETLTGSSNSPRDTALDIEVTGVIPADWIATNDGEFDAIMANNSAADLSGKIIELQGDNFTTLTIANKDIAAVGDPLTIRAGAGGAKIVRVRFSAQTEGSRVSGIILQGIEHQMTGWPANFDGCGRFDGHASMPISFDEIYYEGCSFRHGYGPSLVNFDTAADLPEYERVDNVETATTTSTTYALTWKDPTANSAWVEFFNRGSETIYPQFGGPGVTTEVNGGYTAWSGAGGGVAGVPPGARRRAMGLDTNAITHVAVITESGSSEYNARTEVGLSYYLASAFARSGNANMGHISFRNCTFRDLANAIKGAGFEPRSMVVMDNDFDRIYQDNLITQANAEVHRNIFSIPFARSGIAEGAAGDARDPHGDLYQIFDNNPENDVEHVYASGNVTRWGPRRPGIGGQGFFWSDNDLDPSYDLVYGISNILMCGANNGISSGEENYPLGRAAFYGNTVLRPTDLAGGGTGIRLTTDGNYTIYVGENITQNISFPAHGVPFPQVDNLIVSSAANPAAVLPNLTDLFTAETRQEIQAALTSAAEGAAIGAVALADAVDWETSDPEAVIRWENVPSFAAWLDATNIPIDEMYETPLACILNKRPSQTVIPESGEQWRSFDTDKTTLLQDWTASPGTIEPYQYIQLRKVSPDEGWATMVFDTKINGFAARAKATTGPEGIPEDWLIIGGRFVSPSNVSGVSRMRFAAKIYLEALPPTTCKLFAQESTGCDLEIINNGSFRATVEDSTGTKMLQAASFGVAAPVEEWAEVIFDVDQDAETATLILNGEPYILPFTTSGTGVFQTRPISFLAVPNGTAAIPAGTGVADMSVELDGVPFKAISNIADDANEDPWRQGDDFTQGS